MVEKELAEVARPRLAFRGDFGVDLGQWRYLSGGPLGNAILLAAMVTATCERV